MNLTLAYIDFDFVKLLNLLKFHHKIQKNALKITMEDNIMKV